MHTRKRIGVISLGCSKNRINSEQMMFLLSQAGYVITGDTSDAEAVLINTCGFIESAKTEALETIQEAAEQKTAGNIRKIIVAGCLPERYKTTITNELPEVDAVVGTGSFDDIVEIVDKLFRNDSKKSKERDINNLRKPDIIKQFGNINAPVSETPRILSTSPVWAYLKIAEGCDNKCAYCCIPDIRGKFRSRPMENIINEAKRLVKSGVLEIIPVAQDLTNYGKDLYGKNKLSELLTELNKIDKLPWIRLHYLYPDEITDELIDVIAKSDKILKYMDIPIQHINSQILKRMNRRGSGDDIRKLFKRIRDRIPEVILRTSLITGLPGEGEQEFNELYEFLEETKIEKVGIFAYSPEAGTTAALMERPDQETAEKRALSLQELQNKIMAEHNQSRIGTKVPVLIEDMIVKINQKDYSLARSYAESPDIDGYICISSKVSETGKNDRQKNSKMKQSIKKYVNTITDVRIIKTINGELIGVKEPD